MNDQTIENLLRKSPVPIAPADLADQIKSAVRMPAAPAETVNWSVPQSWFKRWLPAFSFALLLLSCVVVIGVQNTLLAKKQKANDLLRAQTADFDSLQQANAEVQRLHNENAQLDRLQRDNAELLRLQTELAQPLANVANLRAENERLKSAVTATPADTNDFFAAAQARAERIHCVNNLKQFGLAVRLWETDNGNVCPTNVIAMTNELSTWKVLQCPTDHSHIVSSWADVVAGNISYPYYGAGLSESDNNNQIVMAECPIHHNILLSDGSVQQLSPEAYSQQIQIIDGRKVYVPKQ